MSLDTQDDAALFDTQGAEIPTKAPNALAVPKTGIVEFEAAEAKLAELKRRLHDIAYPALNTDKGMALAIADRAEVRRLRVDLAARAEQLNKEDRKQTAARCQQRDAGAGLLIEHLRQLETPIDGQIKAEEERKRVVREEKERAEAARVARIRERIAAIRIAVEAARDRDSAGIQAILDAIEGAEITPERFEEFVPDAWDAVAETQRVLGVMLESAKRLEAEAEARRQLAEQQERERAALAVEQAQLAERAEQMRREQAELEERRAAFEREREEFLKAKAPVLTEPVPEPQAPEPEPAVEEAPAPMAECQLPAEPPAEPPAEAPAPAPIPAARKPGITELAIAAQVTRRDKTEAMRLIRTVVVQRDMLLGASEAAIAALRSIPGTEHTIVMLEAVTEEVYLAA